MSSMRPFQIILIFGFGILAIIALFVMNQWKGSSKAEELVYGRSVEIWGSLPAKDIKPIIKDLDDSYDGFGVVTYREVDERSFESEYINAVAEGNSPDLLLINANKLVSLRSKIQPIPYSVVTERSFRDTYIDAGEIFALNDGVYALPIATDPIVMYWNRNQFSNAGIPQPPTTWETYVSTVVPRLTDRNSRREIMNSAIAFGEYQNVKNAKEVILMLALQSGSRMIEETEKGYDVSLNTAISGNNRPLADALTFYTNFSNTNSPLYSWNRSQAKDLDAFIAEDLAVYFGFGSEYYEIQNKNPNLNFDVAIVPQGSTATVRRTYADVYGLAISATSDNKQGAYLAATVLTGVDGAKLVSEMSTLTPVRRDVIGVRNPDLFKDINYQSALFSRSWLDPSDEDSSAAFSLMTEDVTSNRANITSVVSDALGRLELELKK